MYLPFISLGKQFPCGMNAAAFSMLEAMQRDERQCRQTLECVGDLVRAAQWKAEEIQNKGFWDHNTPDGETPNDTARRFGIVLPTFYAEHGNNIESLAGGYKTAQEALDGLWQSEDHKKHVFGLISFYKRQQYVGIGFSWLEKGIADPVWCILTSESVSTPPTLAIARQAG